MMHTTALALQDWEAAGHSIVTAWLELVGRFGLGALALFFALVIARAWLRRHRYRAVDVLGETDLARVHAALTEAEKQTVGEIVPVVLERSDTHPAGRWVAAVFFVLIGSALIAPWLPWDRPALLSALQLAMGCAGYALAAYLPDFQRRFVRESRATEMASEQAMQEFYRHGLQRTAGQTGVLLFISLFEHRAIVLADEGINAKVSAEQWNATNEAMLTGIRNDSLADGLVAGIESAAKLLAEHFPWTDGDRNEIPDRVIVRRE